MAFLSLKLPSDQIMVGVVLVTMLSSLSSHLNLQTYNIPISTEILGMFPYLITIAVVAGLVGGSAPGRRRPALQARLTPRAETAHHDRGGLHGVDQRPRNTRPTEPRAQVGAAGGVAGAGGVEDADAA